MSATNSDASKFPYDTVVYITDTIGGTRWQASGVLISPDEVLTASHVVYSSTYGTASDIVVTPAYASGAAPFGSGTGTTIHYNAVDDANQEITNSQSQLDYAVIHLAQPISGIGQMGLQANFPGGAVNVTGYPASAGGAQVTGDETVTDDPTYSLLDGPPLGPGSSGGPVWITGSNGQPYVVGLTSSGVASGQGYFTEITTSAYNQIEAWVAQDDGATNQGSSQRPGAGPVVIDATTGQHVAAIDQPYTGPVAGLQNEYVNITSDSLEISVNKDNWFIRTGGGNDAIAVHGGVNVVDGGGGSNFLTSGTGTDTFFVDANSTNPAVWSTIVNFHAGDAATIWGVAPTGFSLTWQDGQGATRFTGLTLHAASSSGTAASLTLAGCTETDLANGLLSVSFGTAGGSPYMDVHANA
jgi:V8-like Glu-specific endopeptidase